MGATLRFLSSMVTVLDGVTPGSCGFLPTTADRIVRLRGRIGWQQKISVYGDHQRKYYRLRVIKHICEQKRGILLF